MTTKSTKPETAPKPDAATAKVGDTIAVPGPGGLMVLPGGTVVTVRADYTFRHAGDHVLILSADGETTETSITVSEAKPA